MRANLGVPVARGLLALPKSTLSFDSLAHFYAHHTGNTMPEAQRYLTPAKVRECALKELNDPRVKCQLKKQP